MRRIDDPTLKVYPAEFTHGKKPRPGSAGMSGDDQGLSDFEQSGSESVRELVEEGQYLEAEAVMGVENAPDPDQAPVRTKEVPENDVPEEYTGQDQQTDAR